MKYKRIMEVLDEVYCIQNEETSWGRMDKINDLVYDYANSLIGSTVHNDFYLGFMVAVDIIMTLLGKAHEEDKKNKKRKMVEVDKVIQAVDKHTKENGSLDEGISVILEEAVGDLHK